MKILGIESSCDETAAAVVKDGRKILSNVVASQIELHRRFGGVVPEVAARSHLEVILPVVQEALDSAKLGWDDIDGLAVTAGPGLPGALLVGVMTARTLAVAKRKPLYGLNHVEAHAYANWFLASPPKFPLLALIVSGGHSQLVLFADHFNYRMLGQTVDDAVGEAFDKVAKLLGLGFPGGPAIAAAALKGRASQYKFPQARLDNPYDFSFSGLKTAVLRHLQKLVGQDYSFPSHQIASRLSQQQVKDTAAAFQQNAVETLVGKTLAAVKEFKPASVVIAGGVAANQELRRQLQARLPMPIKFPEPALCTDNAAMIAALGFFAAKAGRVSDPLRLESDPSLSM